MIILTTTYRVRRWTRRDFTGFQALERVTRVFGVQVWSQKLDEEDVPSWCAIQRACLGYTEWKSRLFREYAHLLDN